MLKISLALSLLSVSVCFGAAEPAAVFAPARGDRAAAFGPGAQGTVIRARAIEPDLAALHLVEAGPRSAVRLNLFEDADLLVTVDRSDERDLFGYTWTGRVVGGVGGGAGGSFVLSVEEDAVMGAVWLGDGRAFEIRSDAAGTHWATEIDQGAFEPCGTGAEHCVHAAHEPLGPGRPRGGACDDDGSLIDVLVVYTPSARNAAGGTNAITALANSAVASANSAYQNSNIAPRLRLVHLAEIDYQESSNGNSTDLGRLRDVNDGFMDEVHALRNQHNADMVAMISNGSNSCGVAYLMTNLSTGFRTSAFSVTRYSCAVGNLTFAHELGHNMGSAHDRDNSGSALFSYSYGHRWFGTNGTQYRSVMAYSPGSRRPHFSNPDVLFAGTPTGIPAGQANAADNARSINEAASTVANFRISGDATAPIIVAGPQDQTVQAGDSVVFLAGAVGLEPLQYQWFRDGQQLLDDGRISGAATSTLIIQDVGPADAGAYQLLVGNACGTTPSEEGVLTVSSGSCPPDLAEPFGTLNFFDLSAYLALYNAGDAAADLAAPAGVLNFFDVSAYLAAYNAGCP